MKPKFRAWDSLENKMRYDIGVIEFNAFDKNVSALAFNHHLDDTGYGEINNSQSEYYDALCFKLMQYTGLKDKNGTEIYVGDIVDFDGFHEIRFGIHGVPRLETEKYVDTATGFYFKPQHDLKDVKPFNLDIPLNDRYANECVVVSNIYENPELLEDDNHASN